MVLPGDTRNALKVALIRVNHMHDTIWATLFFALEKNFPFLLGLLTRQVESLLKLPQALDRGLPVLRLSGEPKHTVFWAGKVC